MERMNVQQPNHSDISDPNAPYRHQHPLTNYQFSSEELRVLRECNTESFFQRSLPFGTGIGLAAYFGVKHGYLRPNTKYGALPKVMVGVIVGYFVGKFSYQQKCAEKIMRLPNSKFGEVLRQRHKGGIYGVLTPDQSLGTGLALSPFTPNSGDIYTDEHPRHSNTNSLELDPENRPSISGLDDIYRPSLDDPAPLYENDIPILAPKQGVTYDELRTKNREEYASKGPNRFLKNISPDASTAKHSSGKDFTEESHQLSLGQRNKYGDTWTN